MNMKKILVAEDSSVIQNLTKKILTLQNYQITSVKNGEQVLEKLKDESFDLILMDINMPVMDGIECTKRVRALSDEIKKNVPIVAITGNARNYSMEEFVSLGINDFIPKPLNFDQLVEKVRTYTS